MLDEHNIEYRYREYTQEPLSAEEIRQVLQALGVEARQVLRKRDPAYRELGLSGDESEEKLISAMASNPTLLQRPIGIVGRLGHDAEAAVGRPPERLLDLTAPAP